MMVESLEGGWCTQPGCDRPSDRGRPLCPMHQKRKQRGQDMNAPVAEKLPPKQRLYEACNTLADADTDEEYAAAERAIESASLAIERDRVSARVKRGIARRRAQGLPVGRRPKLSPAEATELVKRWGSVKAAAAHAGVSMWTVARAMSRNRVSARRRGRCPRPGGGSP